MSSTSATAAAAAGINPITTLHPDIIQSHILNRLDGSTLASTSCASSQFLSLCSDDHLWRRICHSTWPSTAHPTVRAAISNYRSFYADSFPTVRYTPQINGQSPNTSELISAVDVHYDGELIYSNVISTDTISSWFLASPFHLDLLETKETVKLGGACMERDKERLRVSWILIDGSKKRAVNVASLTAVDGRRHWLTEELQLRYATIVSGDGGEMVQLAVVVTFGGKEEGIREMRMQVEDVEGRTLTGEESLVILKAAMEGQRCKITSEVEKDEYEMFLRRKVQLKEKRQKREMNLDMICISTAVLILFLIWVIFLFS